MVKLWLMNLWKITCWFQWLTCWMGFPVAILSLLQANSQINHALGEFKKWTTKLLCGLMWINHMLNYCSILHTHISWSTGTNSWLQFIGSVFLGTDVVLKAHLGPWLQQGSKHQGNDGKMYENVVNLQKHNDQLIQFPHNAWVRATLFKVHVEAAKCLHSTVSAPHLQVGDHRCFAKRLLFGATWPHGQCQTLASCEKETYCNILKLKNEVTWIPMIPKICEENDDKPSVFRGTSVSAKCVKVPDGTRVSQPNLNGTCCVQNTCDCVNIKKTKRPYALSSIIHIKLVF